ncbi:MAG: flagellar export chaperone FliS [Opitutaceae bacterium]
MFTAKKLASYKTVAVDTASPGRLVLMLFDGALRFMSAAELGFESDCPRTKQETVHNNLIRAQEIIQELQRALNLKQGGEFAANMFRLYDFMNTQLMEANLKKEPENIRVVARLLGEIRDAWEQMLREQGSRIEQPAGLSLSA